jgi:hypothetical protein
MEHGGFLQPVSPEDADMGEIFFPYDLGMTNDVNASRNKVQDRCVIPCKRCEGACRNG